MLSEVGFERNGTSGHGTPAAGRPRPPWMIGGRGPATGKPSADRRRVEREVEVLGGVGRLDHAGLEHQVSGWWHHRRRAEPGALEDHGRRVLRRDRQHLPGEVGEAVGEGEQLYALGRARRERADTDRAAPGDRAEGTLLVDDDAVR